MSAAGELVLYDKQGAAGGCCPFAQRARVALAEKGAAFELRLVRPSARPAEFMQLWQAASPDPAAAPKVPLLVHARDGQQHVLVESAHVVEYLEEVARPEKHTRYPRKIEKCVR